MLLVVQKALWNLAENNSFNFSWIPQIIVFLRTDNDEKSAVVRDFSVWSEVLFRPLRASKHRSGLRGTQIFLSKLLQEKRSIFFF